MRPLTASGAAGDHERKRMLARKETLKPLWQRVPELAGFSAAMLYVADVGSDRLSLTQAAFFLLAATTDAAGRPATRTELLTAYHESFRGSIRNSYRQLLEPTRLYPKALGWLRAEENPQDSREQFLRLTDEGRSVINGALMALEPLTPTKLGERPH